MPGLRLRLAQHRPIEVPSWEGGRLCVIEKPGLACVVAKRSTKGQSSRQRVPTGRLWPPAKLACFKSDVLTPEGPAPLEGDGGGAGVGVGLGAQRGASQTW